LAICWLLYNATLQTGIDERFEPHNYSWAPAGVAAAVAVTIALLVGFGGKAHDFKMGAGAAPEG
jgi:hypothetical protein